ncbi:MAG: pyridoxamine 5'-phosphate oxidase family protein [Clostridia bacterium]|nr:pyridoxamine 5'-phosphate oxidase family protein [Clostridia bacterium]
MFREVVRHKQALSCDECVRLLTELPRGVLSVITEDGYPYAFPINQYYRDGCLYFHSGPSGHKIDCMKACDKASFCAYDNGFRKPGEWALNISSVICFGRLDVVEDHDEALELSRLLSLKFTSDTDYIDREIARSGQKVLVFRLKIEHMTGKLVNEA